MSKKNNKNSSQDPFIEKPQKESEVKDLEEDALEIEPKKEVKSDFKSEVKFDFPPDVKSDSDKKHKTDHTSSPRDNESDL